MKNEFYEYHSLKKMPIIFSNTVIKRTSFEHLHWHENIEVLLFYEGTSEILVDDKIFTADAGDIVVVNSSMLHCTRAISDLAKYYVLIIDKDFCEQLGFRIEELHVNAQIKDKRLFEVIRDIECELASERDYHYAGVIYRVIEILIILFRDYPADSTSYATSKNIEMVKTAIKYIKNNFTKPITVEDIAKNTGYSKYYFCRCFKEITTFTVNAYMNQVRVNYAYKLISENNVNVYNAALQSGFSDPSYFTKVFKKYFSVSPSQVKRDT